MKSINSIYPNTYQHDDLMKNQLINKNSNDFVFKKRKHKLQITTVD